MASAAVVQPDSTFEDRQAHALALADSYRLGAIAAELGSGRRTVDDLSAYDKEVATRHGISEFNLRNPGGIALEDLATK